MKTPLIFDGHNDVLLKQYEGGATARAEFTSGNEFHIDDLGAKRHGRGQHFRADDAARI